MRNIIYDLPDPEFVNELRRLGGVPVEVLDNAELLQLLLPLLRANFAVTQTYRYLEGLPLRCRITAVGGQQDENVTREQLASWQELTRGDFSFHRLPGSHFFLHTSKAMMLEIIAHKLARLGNGTS